MNTLDDLNLDVVTETKAATEASMKETLLDAIALAHDQSSSLAMKALKETGPDGKGAIVGLAATMLIMNVSAGMAVTIVQHFGIDTAELDPPKMRARFERLKAAGKVPA